MTLQILIIGATSTIAHACARRWAAGGASFVLAGRRAETLQQNADDLLVRSAGSASIAVYDFDRFDTHEALVDEAWQRLGRVDIVLIAHGTLPDQAACEADAARTLQAFETNAISVIGLLTAVANRMQAQKSGVIAVISSVAGDRGRPSNYIYGAAKAAVTTFCSGLRGRLYGSGVHVLTIRPGFVDTPMTAGLSLPRLLVASPETVADRIVAAVDARRDDIYVPGFWRPIMFLIRTIPTRLFKRLKL